MSLVNNVPSPPGQQLIFFHGPAHPVSFLSVHEKHNGGYPLDVESRCQLGIFLGIDLCHNPPSSHLSRHLLHHRCKVKAMRSPGGPELHQYCPLVSVYERAEAPVGKGDRFRIKGEKRGVAFAAFAGLPFARCGDTVGRAAGGAVDKIMVIRRAHQPLLKIHNERFNCRQKAKGIGQKEFFQGFRLPFALCHL